MSAAPSLARVPAADAVPIQIEGVSHWYGEGALRRQIIFDVSAEIRSGEIVIVSGPSGSGKTTLLTLIGALRSTQAGSLRVLGQELRGANERTLTAVRRQIGYVFQSHNLLDALTVRQNVQLGLQPRDRAGSAARADTLLASVGLAEYGDRHPNEISGGQRQRVAIARALIAEPRIVLADEPTASLDKETGRQIATLLERLAREHGVTVLLVTHDHRILDVADRILALEDGRISSFMRAVTEGTRRLWSLLARDLRQGELVRRVREISADRFAALLESVTEETRELLAMVEVAQSETFDSALAQVLEAFALKSGEVVGAQATRVYLVDPQREDVFSLRPAGSAPPLELRAPLGRGLAGRAAQLGVPLAVADAAQDAGFDPQLDLASPERAGPVLALPLLDSERKAFAVIELARGAQDLPFRPQDQARLEQLGASLALILQTWFRMSCSCRTHAPLAAGTPCCGGPQPCPHCG
jgi:putative ABC transport system ATP-binding protein